jgi:hypothetical protein
MSQLHASFEVIVPLANGPRGLEQGKNDHAASQTTALGNEAIGTRPALWQW